MTDEILSELMDTKGKRTNDVTPLYNEISAMRHFNLSPAEWHRLSRFDRLLLTYQRIMSLYYEKKAADEMKREAEKESKRREFMSKMPQLARGRARR